MNKKQINALQIVIEYFYAWNNNNFQQAADYLADNISFEMPINSYKTKNDFINAVQFTKSISEITLLSQLGNHEEAVLIYNLEMKGIFPFQICEHFKVQNGKVVFIRHIHDTYQLREKGFDKGNS